MKNEFKDKITRIENLLQKWVVYAIYFIMILMCVNSCNSCNRNNEDMKLRKEITSLKLELKKNDSITNLIINKVATKNDIMRYNDTLIGRFVYWQKQLDKGAYNNDMKTILNMIKEKDKEK